MDGDTKQQHLLHCGYTLDEATQLWMPPPSEGDDDMTLDEAWEHFTHPPISPDAEARYGDTELSDEAVDRLEKDIRDGDDRQGGVAV